MQPSVEELATLHLRSSDGDTDFVREFLNQYPAAVNSAIMGRPLLCEAAFSGSIELIQLLVARGADVNQTDQDGDSPLQNAIIMERREVFDFLLENGAELGEKEIKYSNAIWPIDGKKGCYIATACYGDYDHPDVLVLRRFRDEVLLHSIPGRVFVRAYYIVSPPMAHWMGEADWTARTLRDRVIRPLVSCLRRRGL